MCTGLSSASRRRIRDLKVCIIAVLVQCGFDYPFAWSACLGHNEDYEKSGPYSS